MASKASKPEHFFKQQHALAEQGDREAQYWTGNCYFWGKGVEKKRSEALKWYQRSAEQGSGKAKHKLGDCYAFRFVAPHNSDDSEDDNDNDYYYDEDDDESDDEAETAWRESMPLLTEEAEEGDTEAMFLLGLAFCKGMLGLAEGNGIPSERDTEQALHWMQRAAAEGNNNGPHAGAQHWLASGYEYGAHGLAVNKQLAFKWYCQSAENGNSQAQHRLGMCYHHGMHGVVDAKADWSLALYWYQQAKENGSYPATPNLNRLLQEISILQARLQRHLNESLNRISIGNNNNECSSSSSLSIFPLGLWPHALAELAAKRHRPAGCCPTFSAMKRLVPHLFFNAVAGCGGGGSLKRPHPAGASEAVP